MEKGKKIQYDDNGNGRTVAQWGKSRGGGPKLKHTISRVFHEAKYAAIRLQYVFRRPAPEPSRVQYEILLRRRRQRRLASMQYAIHFTGEKKLLRSKFAKLAPLSAKPQSLSTHRPPAQIRGPLRLQTEYASRPTTRGR